MDTNCKKNQTRRHPVETSNFLSLLFFGWTVPIFWKGTRRDLKITDLYDPLTSDESGRLGDRLEREWKKELVRSEGESKLGKNGEKKRSRKPNLLWAITRMFWAPFMLQGILLLFQAVVLRVMQPVLQGLIISYFDTGENTITKKQALLYATLLVLVTLGTIFILHHTNLQTRLIGMRVRVACCSMIYRKILRLNQAAVHKTAAGQLANLISNDVARFDEVPKFLHHVWIMPIQMSLVGFMMWRTVGVVALVGIGVLVMQTVFLQGYLSSLTRKLRTKIAVITDERVQLMTDLISGIQVVKMYVWEKSFELLVSRVRGLEMKFIRDMAHIRIINSSSIGISREICLCCTLIAYVLMGNSLTAEVAFVIQGLFAALNYTCIIAFPQAIISSGEGDVSLKRITEFLLIEESKTPENVKPVSKCAMPKSVRQLEHRVAVNLSQVRANWLPNQLSYTLSDISINVRSGSLCTIVGSVGSGKTSLLHVLLGELPVQSGIMSLVVEDTNEATINSRNIKISYASQNSWLFSASVRDNILFGEPYDEGRYREVTRVCALLEDFEKLPDGDSSFVGERGASLSGGQKARVNLARAVYKDADLYLLDDPLSAVDPRVSRHLFEECITRFLKDKTRILVTHQLQYLRQTDKVVVLSSGTVKYQGTYDQLVMENVWISEFGDSEELNKVEGTVKSLGYKTTTRGTDYNENSPEVTTESTDTLRGIDEEEVSTGDMSNDVYWEYFKAGGNVSFLVFVALVFAAGQAWGYGADYWVSFWANQEILRSVARMNISTPDNISSHNETRCHQREMNSTDSIWFDEYGLLQPNMEIYGYMVCICSCVFFTILYSLLFVKMCTNASCNVHNSMFRNLLRSRMRFFNRNPSGRILNRFSKDVGTMDEILPSVIFDTFRIYAVMIGIFTLIVIVNHWMILPVAVISGAFFILRYVYLKTAQDVTRLEGIAKSPMFSHTNFTLDGLTTIRSRGAEAEEWLRREFDRHQDTHTSTCHSGIAITSAFGFTVDLISCCFIACVCFSFVLLDAGNTLGGFVGLAISKSLSLCGMVQYGVKQSTDLVSKMTSVERILQYTNLPTEGHFTTENPPPSTWPSQGGLIMKNVTMRYADNEPPVLKNLNVHISPGWKVGIVGRTGAGKSSLVSALFRLTGEGLEGEIVLDGINTGSLGLHELRPRISIIPQEPILFSATLRENLDPFNEYDDPRLWNALHEVEFSHAIPSLDFHVAGSGANFSVGQRQLICLARAILKNNRVLVLDEATANIDHGTDALIQSTIRKRFADCTVLTIAHRLNTIMDSDRVLVMKEGSIVEFDHPHLLLQIHDSHFSRMLQQTGTVMAKRLAEVAKHAFSLNSEFEDRSPERLSPCLSEQNTRL